MEKPLESSLPNDAAPSDKALSNDALAKVRAQNTQSNLKSNFWYDIASYTRWLSTLSFMGGLYFIGQALNAAGASMTTGTLLSTIGTTVVGGPFLACVAFGLTLAVATVATSKYSRRVFVDKTFDVQEFQMQRQAALVGQSVERAFDEHQAELANWSGKMTVRPADSHVARLQQQPETAPAATR